MKKAIVTISIGSFYEKMGDITHPTIKAYADRIGADFIVWRDVGTHSMPHYRKLDLHEMLTDYDRVMYIDTDILIRDDAPDLFEIVPEDQIGLFEEGRFADRAQGMMEFLVRSGINPNTWNRRYYNTGVIVFSKVHAPLFVTPPKEEDHFKEQTYINMLLSVLQPKVFPLNYKFNRMSLIDPITGEDRKDSFFMHYAGCNVQMPERDQLNLMIADLAEWKRNKGKHKYRKNILVNISGGLGDQICAEPVARFIRDVLYPEDNVQLISDFPEVFDHLGLPVLKKGSVPVLPGSFYRMETLRPPEHISWDYMSHLLVHGVDFCALQSIRTVLPFDRKQIVLKYGTTDKKAVLKLLNGLDEKKTAIIHPGRGWATKTFPAEVWQSYADALLDSGFNVVVIGKRIGDDQGVVEIDTSRCLDLIDKLSFRECLALLDVLPVVISNDSAPIHMAGAFDNWIGLIATCKNPDYVLPWRQGRTTYKTKALEEFRLYDTWNGCPSQADPHLVDKCSPETLAKCLPSSSAIVQFVKDCLSS